MRIRVGGCIAAVATLGAVGTALAHDFDHPAPGFSQPAPLSSAVNAGGNPDEGVDAEWSLVTTIPTGNPQSDLDFFTIDGITYASVGTLAIGANSAGQNIIQLTNAEGDVEPQYVTGHPSATCISRPDAALSLQHDSEAAPKGTALPHWPNLYVDQSDTQVVIDATDDRGRCHDSGTIVANPMLPGTVTPPGGLEIIDVTNPEEPKEIGLTSHIGEAHTVNVDPKRPHIAFISSSDNVFLNEDGERPNEAEGNTSDAFDGIEVVDFSSCLNFPADTTLEQKRTGCRPRVYRYRWPNANIARSHTYRSATGACHELEIYPDDRVVCAGLAATPVFDFSGAFDDNGTPSDFTDDKPKGTPLPCRVRESSTMTPGFETGAFVTDCANGQTDADPEPESLQVDDWVKLGAPSLEGVEHLGTFHHMGYEDQAGNNFEPEYNSKEDIFVAHEAELTQSGRYVLVSDERGGGVLPGGSTCSPGADNDIGNGGIHAFRVDTMGTGYPAEGAEAVEAYQNAVYATDSEGNRAVYRAPINTKPQGAVCTSHVFQQIPGQNRIFMGWYSQATQVVDFTENADGTIDFKTAGFFIPENANEWVSHIFKVQANTDGTFTYWGATGDFAVGDAGRNAIDIYQVTMSPPPKPRTASGEPPPGTPKFPTGSRPPSPNADPGCASASGYNALRSKPRKKRKRVRFSFRTAGDSTVDATIFRRGVRRRVVRKRVKKFNDRTGGFTWRPRRVRNGFYDVRFKTRAPNGTKDVRHLSVRRRNGRFYNLPPFDRRSTCSLVRYYSLGRSVFGGRKRSPLRVRFNLDETSDVAITVRRRGKVVRRLKEKSYPSGKSARRIRLRGKAKRGPYRVTLKATHPGQVSELTLFARYL